MSLAPRPLGNVTPPLRPDSALLSLLFLNPLVGFIAVPKCAPKGAAPAGRSGLEALAAERNALECKRGSTEVHAARDRGMQPQAVCG